MPACFWRVGDGWGTDSDWLLLSDGGRYTVSDDGDLNIPNFNSEQDNDLYICEALQQETGDMQQKHITVIGHGKCTELTWTVDWGQRLGW